MTSILIVEDDVLTNEYLEFILQQAGYEVVSAASADEAVALLEDHDDVQLIVTDINLPGTMNGLKLAAAVKARRPEMNIIIVTGYGAPPLTLRAAPICLLYWRRTAWTEAARGSKDKPTPQPSLYPSIFME